MVFEWSDQWLSDPVDEFLRHLAYAKANCKSVSEDIGVAADRS
jgi:hypothetical protein